MKKRIYNYEETLKGINIENPIFLFLAGGFLSGLFFLGLSFVGKEYYFRIFFYRSWYVQGISTWLFLTSVLYIIMKYYSIKREENILDAKVAIDRLSVLTPERAQEILEVIPDKYKNSISFRRMGELLRGYLHGEEIVRLNQELSRRDAEQIEGGHLILNAMKQLIPVLGFLGTVIGLAIAMIQFSDLTESAGLELIRAKLKDMGASLSVAFETTVLALGYTIILILNSSFLRRKEESFVADVDNKARLLISKLSYRSSYSGKSVDKEGFEGILDRFNEITKEWLNKWQGEFLAGMKELLGQLSVQNENHRREVVDILRSKGDALLNKMDELKDGMQKTPH